METKPVYTMNNLTEELKAELADKYESLFPFKTPYKENEQFNKEQIERRKQFVEAATSDIAKKIHTQGYISVEEHERQMEIAFNEGRHRHQPNGKGSTKRWVWASFEQWLIYFKAKIK